MFSTRPDTFLRSNWNIVTWGLGVGYLIEMRDYLTQTLEFSLVSVQIDGRVADLGCFPFVSSSSLSRQSLHKLCYVPCFHYLFLFYFVRLLASRLTLPVSQNLKYFFPNRALCVRELQKRIHYPCSSFLVCLKPIQLDSGLTHLHIYSPPKDEFHQKRICFQKRLHPSTHTFLWNLDQNIYTLFRRRISKKHTFIGSRFKFPFICVVVVYKGTDYFQR